MFGIPSVLRTDSGTSFQGEQFANFATDIGFKHKRIRPMHPKANGVVERNMKTLSKTVLISHIQGQNLKIELNTFYYSTKFTYV